MKKSKQIERIRRNIGWIYSDLPWFTEEEARKAQSQRENLLRALSGWVTQTCQGSKLHTGALSPGCMICGTGGWGCNYINYLCTRNCFYCLQDRSIKEEGESNTWGIKFKNPSEHILFLKTFQISGVGFSGGEPLLVFDRLLDHITSIRKELGNSIYLWMYTNGDLLDRNLLKELKEAGLNEIRFDISARKYDMTPVYLSKEYIPTVTVEIPVIPEDFDILKELLSEMEKAGVNFLNLHQLFTSPNNYKALCKRNYHFLHAPGIPIHESELCALKLLLFAREHQISMPINYCCSVYKKRFQGRNRRMRLGRLVLNGNEELTSSGYIRIFKILDSTDKINAMISSFVKDNHSPSLWQCNERKTEIFIHRSLLPYADWSSADVAILYLQPDIALKNQDGQVIKSNLIPLNKVVYEEHDWSQFAIETWEKLYMKKLNSGEVFKQFLQNYPGVGKDKLPKLQKEASRLIEIADWEEIESGLADMY